MNILPLVTPRRSGLSIEELEQLGQRKLKHTSNNKQETSKMSRRGDYSSGRSDRKG